MEQRETCGDNVRESTHQTDTLMKIALMTITCEDKNIDNVQRQRNKIGTNKKTKHVGC